MLPKEEDSHNEDFGQKVFLREAVCKSQLKYSQKVLSRSAFSSSMAWILHGLTHTGCLWQKDIPADVSEPWLPYFGRWVRHKSLLCMCKDGSFRVPLSSCLYIQRVLGTEPTTTPGRPRAALMKALRPVRHFGSLQPVASTHPSFGGNTPVMSFLSPSPPTSTSGMSMVTSAEMSCLVFSMLSELIYVQSILSNTYCWGNKKK